MIDNIRRRLRSEQGFTLIELLVVIIILAILVAIAVPAYFSLTGRATVAAGEANVRTALPAAESWYQDANGGNGSYVNITGNNLRIEAPGVSPTVMAVALNNNLGFCVQDTEGTNLPWSYIGGTATPVGGYKLATIQQATCLAAAGTAAT